MKKEKVLSCVGGVYGGSVVTGEMRVLASKKKPPAPTIPIHESILQNRSLCDITLQNAIKRITRRRFRYCNQRALKYLYLYIYS